MKTSTNTVSLADCEARINAFVRFAEDVDTTQPLLGMCSPTPLADATLAVKDLFDVKGLPTSCGSPIYAERVATQTAKAVRCAQQAGARVIGKTVTTEFATFKPGPTINPQNPSCTPGGSSSGSAASVGAGMASHGIGTQTAGSVIRPAAYCGVVGFLPTMGCVSRDGLKVVSPSLDRVGVFARSVGEAKDIACAIADLGTPATPENRPKRIGFFDDETWAEADSFTQKALQDFKIAVQEAGDIVVDLGPGAELFKLLDAQCDVMAFEVLKSLAPELTHHSELISEQLHSYCRDAARITATQYANAIEIGQTGRVWIERLFSGLDVIACPSAKTLPPRTLANTGDPYVNRAWSLLYVPCITLPTSQLDDNLKGAIQLVGGFGDDRNLLDIAAQFEQRVAKIGAAEP